MSGEAEQVYTTQQAAERVGVGAAMLRRYAQTYEGLTGHDIPHTRRDGRRFFPEHISAFQQARTLINDNRGLSVESALRAVVQGDAAAAAPILPSVTSSALDTAAFVDAIRDAVTAPLVAELRELQAEVRELKEARALPPVRLDETNKVSAGEPGTFARIGQRFDALLRRVRG